MQITDLLAQTGGLQSIAKELGLSESQAASGAAALAPAILGGFKKQAQSQPAGLESLGGLLGKLGGGALLDDVLSPQPTNVNRGNDVLGQIFGSKDVSRTVAQNAAAKTGLSPELLKKMLPWSRCWSPATSRAKRAPAPRPRRAHRLARKRCRAVAASAAYSEGYSEAAQPVRSGQVRWAVSRPCWT
jgi:hypothetical protein